MDTRLTQAQLAQIIAEVDRVSQASDSDLDDQQIQKILQNLHLPNDSFEEAIAHLHRHRFALQQQQRHKIVLSTIAMMIAGLLTTIAVVHQKQQNKIARIAPIQEIVIRQDSAKPVTQFDRQKDAKVFYRVTLKNIPLNDRLIISCNWSDPTGQPVYQSRYQQDITRSPWIALCNAPLTTQSQPGTWTVKMSVEERSIASRTFSVK